MRTSSFPTTPRPSSGSSPVQRARSGRTRPLAGGVAAGPDPPAGRQRPARAPPGDAAAGQLRPAGRAVRPAATAPVRLAGSADPARRGERGCPHAARGGGRCSRPGRAQPTAAASFPIICPASASNTTWKKVSGPAHAAGEQRRRIAEQITEQLEHVPANFVVLQHARIKYACKHCNSGSCAQVRWPGPHRHRRDKPHQPIEGGLAGPGAPGLRGHLEAGRIICPLYTASSRSSPARRVEVSRSTLCGWMKATAGPGPSPVRSDLPTGTSVGRDPHRRHHRAGDG